MHEISGKYRPPKRRGNRKLVAAARSNAKKLWSEKQNKNKESQNKSTAAVENNIISATRRKFSLVQENAKSIAPIESCNENEYMFIHTSALQNLFVSFCCPQCQLNTLSVKINSPNGMAANIEVVCNECNEICASSNSSPLLNPKNKKSAAEINKKIVEGFSKIGCGYSALEVFTSVINIKCLSKTTYYAHLTTIMKEAKKLKDDTLAISRKIVFDVHKKLDPDSAKVIDIMASFDGSYHKRGFTSLYGIGIIFDVLTGLIVDYQIMSKYCPVCIYHENYFGKDTPDFHFWLQDHQKAGYCDKNYSGSSVSMEVAAAELLWKRSIKECNMRYTTLLSDGDAKTFSHLNNQQIYDKPIEKEECINHVSKRITTALKDVVKKAKVKGVTLGGKAKGALTDKGIQILSTYYRNAIIRCKDDVIRMQREIMATLKHCSSTDSLHDHSLCPAGKTSWCFYNKAVAEKQKPKSHISMSVFLNDKVIQHIKPVYERLSNPELLRRCTKGLTQNANEALHSVLWKKCPKEIFVSRKKIEVAAAHAVAEFNMGSSVTANLLLSYSGTEMSVNTKKICDRRDRKRLMQSDSQTEGETKKLRAMKKLNKRKKDFKNVRSEGGVSYGSGLF